MKGDIYEHENGLLDCQIGNSDIVQHFFQAVKKHYGFGCYKVQDALREYSAIGTITLLPEATCVD